MKRLALAGAIVLTMAAAAPVLARPDFACPTGQSGFLRVTVDEWWDRSVEGWAEEGIVVYDAGGGYSAEFDAWAQANGLADGAAVEAYVRGPQWIEINNNGNDHVCMKDNPNTSGNPGWLFVGVDDHAAG